MAEKVRGVGARIKKGDRVMVIAGRDKGRKGGVLRMYPRDDRALVSGVNVVKRHQKQTAQLQGGIVNKEAPIHLSNLAHVDPKTGGATRIGFKLLADGRKVRFAKKSGEVIDV
jgi:large subunit ribosomal protein L24